MRIKHVLNHELYSVFASQKYAKFGASENYGYNASRNRSFAGDTVKSYSTVIAKRFTNAKGEVMILITSKYYSVTTNRQIGELKRACREVGFRTLEVPEFYRWNTNSDAENLSYLWEQYSILKDKAQRARKKWSKSYHQGAAIKFLENAVAYAEFFGLRKGTTPLKSLIEFEKAILATYEQLED